MLLVGLSSSAVCLFVFVIIFSPFTWFIIIFLLQFYLKKYYQNEKFCQKKLIFITNHLWSGVRAEYMKSRTASNELDTSAVNSIAVHFRPKLKTWKAEVKQNGRIAERSVVQSSWVLDVTQDRDVELNPGPPNKTHLHHRVKWRYKDNLQNGGHAPSKPRPHKPRLPEPRQRIGSTP